MLRGMSLPGQPPSDTSNDRRALPRHLRDTEHDGVRDSAASGIRKVDGAGGGRNVFAVVALLVLAAVAAWYVLSS